MEREFSAYEACKRDVALIGGAPNLAEALYDFRTNKTLPHHLENYVKQAADLSHYGIVLDTPQHTRAYGKKFKEQWFDCTYQICLTTHDRFVASLGFAPASGAFEIRQIQGRKGMEHNLQPLHWQRALIDRAADLAREYRVRHLEIRGAQHNKWAQQTHEQLIEHNIFAMSFEESMRLSQEESAAYRKRGEELLEKNLAEHDLYAPDIRLMPRDAFIRYNVTAKRLGFTEYAPGKFRKLLAQ